MINGVCTGSTRTVSLSIDGLIFYKRVVLTERCGGGTYRSPAAGGINRLALMFPSNIQAFRGRGQITVLVVVSIPYSNYDECPAHICIIISLSLVFSVGEYNLAPLSYIKAEVCSCGATWLYNPSVKLQQTFTS